MRCPGCDGEFGDADGPTHEYMLSSPGCWAVYGEVLAREYSNPQWMRLHRLTVDVFAAQHAGVNVTPARRSVAIHLSRLYLTLERGWEIGRVNDAIPAISAEKDLREWLTPPTMTGSMTCAEVLQAGSLAEHEAAVTAWARSVWQAWDAHHATVRAWCAKL